MSSFLEFIREDIESKKVLLSTMPTTGKREIKKYNEKVEELINRYKDYKNGVKKYIDAKYKSLDIKEVDKNLDKKRDTVKKLEQVKFLLNPSNTYVEKMGFDNLLYQISSYSDFDFIRLNEIINQLLDKFDLVGVRLFGEDFNYTCYVREYMTAFLDVRNKKSNNYDKLAEVFEKIYWVNPEIISHIELNFRKLIKKYAKRFIDYIEKETKLIRQEEKINNYNECIDLLKEAYSDLCEESKENVSDILKLSKEGRIDISQYFKESKTRIANFSSMLIEPVDLENAELKEKFYRNLEKLKTNIEEYTNYLKFVPIFNKFRQDYEKFVDSPANKLNSIKKMKLIETQISQKEHDLEKLNKKIFSMEPDPSEPNPSPVLKQMKIESVTRAKELYKLYLDYNKEFFNERVERILRKSLTVAELVHLYYSFDYFKRLAIKEVFGVSTFDEIKEYSDSFDLFAKNPNNVIIDGVLVFEDNEIDKIIMNKYRLYNINITTDNLTSGTTEELLNKINFILRVNTIEKSESDVDKIWFLTQVTKINNQESKSE